MTISATTRTEPQGSVSTILHYAVLALDWSGRIIAASCLAIMFVLLLLNVVLRYSFGDGIPWAYEIHAILLPWLVAGGVVVAACQGRNIAVSLLPDLLSPRWARRLALLVQAIVLLISLTVVWSSQPILKASQFQTLATLGVKQVWGYSSIVYAFGGMALAAALEILRLLAGGERAVDASSLS